MAGNRESRLYDVPTHVYVVSARIVCMHAIDIYDVDAVCQQICFNEIVYDTFKLDYLRIILHVSVERLLYFGHAKIRIVAVPRDVRPRIYAYDLLELPGLGEQHGGFPHVRAYFDKHEILAWDFLDERQYIKLGCVRFPHMPLAFIFHH